MSEAMEAALQAAGWTSDGKSWHTPDQVASVSIVKGKDGAPFYGLTWRGAGNEGGSLFTHDAGRLLESLALADLIPGGYLGPADVARIWTEEERRKNPDARPISVGTVLSYVEKSKPGGDDRYAARPVTAPSYSGAGRGARPQWRAYQESELRRWWRGRPGRGVGGGRPRKRQEGQV